MAVGRDPSLAPPRPDGTARVFFALWPDAAPRAALGRLARDLQGQCGGRAMLTRNIHLTLVFLGNVAAARLPELYLLAETVAAPRFDLVIGAAGYWRHNRIVWTGPGQCPDALQALVAALEGALKANGFRFDERPYVPHITLLRDARRAPTTQAVGDIRWPVADFALVQSLRRDNATVYEVLRRWPDRQENDRL